MDLEVKAMHIRDVVQPLRCILSRILQNDFASAWDDISVPNIRQDHASLVAYQDGLWGGDRTGGWGRGDERTSQRVALRRLEPLFELQTVQKLRDVVNISWQQQQS
jgi:hypothetical protein